MFLPLHDRNPIRHISFPYVTYGLMAVTGLCFLAQSLVPGQINEQAIVVFGVIPAVVGGLVGAPVDWLPAQTTLVTYAFLHANLMHLLSNMLFLWIFGDNVEDALGHLRFFFFYCACAVLAALAHIGFNGQSLGPLIGASGAVAGVMGAYIVLYPHAKVFVLLRIVIPIPLPIPAMWMLGVWIATQAFYAVVAAEEPVAWWAHLGGVVAGAVLAALVKRREVALFGGR